MKERKPISINSSITIGWYNLATSQPYNMFLLNVIGSYVWFHYWVIQLSSQLAYTAISHLHHWTRIKTITRNILNIRPHLNQKRIKKVNTFKIIIRVHNFLSINTNTTTRWPSNNYLVWLSKITLQNHSHRILRIELQWENIHFK